MRRRAIGWLVLCIVPAWSAAAHAQDVPDMGQLVQFIRWGGVLATVPLILIAAFVLRLVTNLGDRFSARFPNRRPAIQKVETILRFAVYLSTLVLGFGLSVRLDQTALTVIGGAMAFAVGFGLRDLVASFIAGVTIMFDRPFQVGDRVRFGGFYGDVETIGLRTVRIRTLDHNIVTVPNNRVFSDISEAGTYGTLEMQVPMDFYLAQDQDLELAIQLVRETCLTSPFVYLAEPITVRADQLLLQEQLVFRIKSRAYVFDSTYEEAFITDVNLRVMKLFREHDLLPPATLLRRAPAWKRAKDIGKEHELEVPLTEVQPNPTRGPGPRGPGAVEP